jgi:SAM-dependent methyltransferase
LNTEERNLSIMKIFQMVKIALVRYGLWGAIMQGYVMFQIPIVDFFFDFIYRTDTRREENLDDLTIGSENKKRGVRYEPTKVLPLRKLFKYIRLMIPTNRIFVDFGCGKGRVLLIASNFGFKEVRGVEFAHELCEIAKNNCAVYKHQTAVSTEFKIIESDVVDYIINPDENVFFMFNPFDEIILNKIINNITTSLNIQPRRILIIYNHPKYNNVIEQQDKFARLEECVFGGIRFALYSNYGQIN